MRRRATQANGFGQFGQSISLAQRELARMAFMLYENLSLRLH